MSRVKDAHERTKLPILTNLYMRDGVNGDYCSRKVDLPQGIELIDVMRFRRNRSNNTASPRLLDLVATPSTSQHWFIPLAQCLLSSTEIVAEENIREGLWHVPRKVKLYGNL